MKIHSLHSNMIPDTFTRPDYNEPSSGGSPAHQLNSRGIEMDKNEESAYVKMIQDRTDAKIQELRDL